MARQYNGMSEQAIQLREELKREELKKQKMFKIIRIGLVILFAFISLMLVITTVTHVNDTNVAIVELNIQIADKQQILTAKQEALAVEGANIEYIDPIVSNSHEAGMVVVDIQNRLSASTLDMKKNNITNISDEHKSTLTELQAYFPNQNNAIKTWCEYGKWHYVTNFEYENGILNTAWLCYEDESKTKLLALATATYNSKKDDFNGFELIRTAHYKQIILDEQERAREGK